jgi:hypothetical protein
MSVTLTAAGAKVAGAAIENGIKMLADLPKGDSLVGYAQAGIMSPTCMVDEDVRNSDMLPDVLQLAQSVYGAYFLRAFSLHNISIGNSNVASRLDKFSTRRNPSVLGAIGGIASAALEEFDDRLVVEGEVRALPPEVQEVEDTVRQQQEAVAATAALESKANGYTVKGQQPAGKNTPPSSATPTQTLKNGVLAGFSDGSASVTTSKSIDISEPVNLGVGRMVNVTIKEDNKEVTVPILIRLDAVYMASAPLVQIWAMGSEDISLGARFKKWRLGGIDFWRDLVFCQDLIDAHKKNLKSDTTGIYLQMMQKRRQNSIAAALSGSMSANSSSNIVVLSQASAEALEMKIGGKLKDFNTRQKLMQQGYGMLMFVIDKQWGRVRMYTRDIPEYTDLGERDLKASNKGNGVDIGDVLKSFQVGLSPRF